MNVSGKLVILTMLGAAVAAAGFGQWYHYSTTRRALELWGGETADLVNRAPRVEALRLVPVSADGGSESSAERVVFDGWTYAVDAHSEISTAPGLVHARRALVEDANFAWDDAGQDCEPVWTYALRFTSGQRTATLLVALNCHRIAQLGSAREVSLRPTITAGLTTFLGEQFSERGN